MAESYRAETSQFAGAVVRVSRVADGFVFSTATVGGSDGTETVCAMVDRLDREDIRYLLVAGLAPAWFNVLDLQRIHDHTDLPVLSVTFESSPGLEGAIREAFDDSGIVQDRLATYHAQPERQPVSVNGETVYVRSVGIDDSAAADVVRAFTPEGGRPEPLRVARLAARGLAEME